MKKIIGVGSVWGADQIGLQIVDHLKKQQQGNFIALTNPYQCLINTWNKEDEVIIVDAFRSDSLIQKTLSCNFSLLKKLDIAPAISTHNFTLLETLLLAESLENLPKKLNLFLININNQKDSFNTQQIKTFAKEVLKEPLNN